MTSIWCVLPVVILADSTHICVVACPAAMFCILWPAGKHHCNHHSRQSATEGSRSPESLPAAGEWDVRPCAALRSAGCSPGWTLRVLKSLQVSPHGWWSRRFAWLSNHGSKECEHVLRDIGLRHHHMWHHRFPSFGFTWSSIKRIKTPSWA